VAGVESVLRVRYEWYYLVVKCLHSDQALGVLVWPALLLRLGPEGSCTLSMEMAELLSSGKASNFVVEASALMSSALPYERISCHGEILSARCPWFDRMISSGLKESKEGKEVAQHLATRSHLCCRNSEILKRQWQRRWSNSRDPSHNAQILLHWSNLSHRVYPQRLYRHPGVSRLLRAG